MVVVGVSTQHSLASLLAPLLGRGLAKEGRRQWKGRENCSQRKLPYKAACSWCLDPPVAEEGEADVWGLEEGSDLRHPSDRSS